MNHKTSDVKIKKITPAELDKIVCEWSMSSGVALTEEQLNSIVDRLCVLMLGFAPVMKEELQ